MSLTRLGRYAGALAVVSLMAFATAAGAAVRVPLSGWYWGNPAPQGNALKAVNFTGGRGYAVGSAGTALRSDDGGLNWVGLATGTAGDLARLQIIDPDTVVVLGGGGCVLRRTDDGGKTFHKLFIVAEVNCPDRVQSAWFVNKTTGYLLLADGSVLKTTDSGESFAKQTAIPGTAASATPGGGHAKDIYFSGPDSGIAFVSAANGDSSAYFTTDAGVSWKPLTIPAGNVERLYRFDANTIYAIGVGTLLRSTDGGATFTKQAFGPGQTLTSIGCADPVLCLITTAKGELNRTTDGGATATPITASSVPLAGAAFGSITRAVAVGAAGQTVVSDDGGVNYTAIGGDIGGSFFGVRRGPVPTAAFAPGAKGQIALTADGGATWKVANVSTSADILDTSWSDAKTGYALDIRGGLFRTLNGGLTWQTLNAGAGAPARALIAVPASDSVLLFGPRGIKRATGGGEFNTVSGKVTQTLLTNANLGGSGIFAWAVGGKRLLRSTNKGASWRSLKLPSSKTRIRQVSFTGSQVGFLLDSAGRVWSTSNGGGSWKERISAGTADISGISFGSSSSGYLSVGSFGDDFTNAYVLHTSDGGKSWRPQAISPGVVGDAGIVAGDAGRAFALVKARGGAATSRQLFATATAGDAGVASPLKIKARPTKFTRKSLKSAKGKVTISGTLAGAIGGEQVTLTMRAVGGTSWARRTVTAGANGGSFSATFTMKSTSVFVAQWAGDSGRNGAGTRPLTVKVTKR